MRFTSLRFTLALCFIAALACAAAAQSEPAAATEASGAGGRQTPATPGIIVRMLEVKHRKPSALAEVLRDLMTPQGYMRAGDEFNVLVVRDTPEGLTRVEEALQKLDRPAPPAENFEVSFYILRDSETPTDRKQYPSIIEPVVKQLESSLPFRGYEYVGTFFSRVADGSRSSGSLRLFLKQSEDDASKTPVRANLFIIGVQTNIRVIGQVSGKYKLELTNTSVNVKEGGYSSEGEQSNFSVWEGEPVCIAVRATFSENFFTVAVIRRLSQTNAK